MASARPVLVIGGQHTFHGEHQTIIGTTVLASKASLAGPPAIVGITSRRIVFKLVSGSIAGVVALAGASATG